MIVEISFRGLSADDFKTTKLFVKLSCNNSRTNIPKKYIRLKSKTNIISSYVYDSYWLINEKIIQQEMRESCDIIVILFSFIQEAKLAQR